jgi:P-type Cu+ transporter
VRREATVETTDYGPEYADRANAPGAHGGRRLLVGVVFTVPLVALALAREFGSIGPWYVGGGSERPDIRPWLLLLLATPVLLYSGAGLLVRAGGALARGQLTSDLLVCVGALAAFLTSVAVMLFDLNNGYVYFDTAALLITLNLAGHALDPRSPQRVGQMRDRVAARYLPLVLVGATLAFGVWYVLVGAPLVWSLLFAVAVLIVAAPFALSLAEPMALNAGIALAQEYGLTLTNPDAIEQSHAIQTVLLPAALLLADERPVVTVLLPTSERARPALDHAALLWRAASALQHSDHPMRDAIVQQARKHNKPLANAQQVAPVGEQGIQARVGNETLLLGSAALMREQGISIEHAADDLARFAQERQSVLMVAADGVALGIVASGTTMHPMALAALDTLRRRGVAVILLAGGDATDTSDADALARQVGATVVQSAHPNETAAHIRLLQAAGPVVALVGATDNEAAAMAQADVSLAGGNTAAAYAAGVLAQGNPVHGLLQLVTLSQQTHATMRRSMIGAVLVHALSLPVAGGALYPFLGYALNPLLPLLVLVPGVSFAVINGLRLRRTGAEDEAEQW